MNSQQGAEGRRNSEDREQRGYRDYVRNQFNFTNSSISSFTHNDGSSDDSTEQTDNCVKTELIYKIDRCCIGLHKNKPDANHIEEVVKSLTEIDEQHRFMAQGNTMQRHGMNARAMFYYICALKMALNSNQIQDAMVKITITAKNIGLGGTYFRDVIEVCQPHDRDNKIYWKACIAVHTSQYCFDQGGFIFACRIATEACDSLVLQYGKEIIQEYEVYCLLLILRARTLHQQKNYKEASEVLRDAGEVVQMVTEWRGGNEDKCRDAITTLKKNREFDNQSSIYS